MDSAKIHMYKELQGPIETTGALIFFLPPYSPDLNLIEVGFSLLKRWIQRHANMTFREDPVARLSNVCEVELKGDRDILNLDPDDGVLLLCELLFDRLACVNRGLLAIDVAELIKGGALWELQLATVVTAIIKEVDQTHDSNVINNARKVMMRCGLSLGVDGSWSTEQLFQ
ncbi:hypothetical protein BBJ28_00026604 [Nothophytophthora sp. Chile5]|nr:hypothetical protein BBJ28_00026604 [Nothophytophthora sp. Chile5]